MLALAKFMHLLISLSLTPALQHLHVGIYFYPLTAPRGHDVQWLTHALTQHPLLQVCLLHVPACCRKAAAGAKLTVLCQHLTFSTA